MPKASRRAWWNAQHPSTQSSFLCHNNHNSGRHAILISSAFGAHPGKPCITPSRVSHAREVFGANSEWCSFGNARTDTAVPS